MLTRKINFKEDFPVQVYVTSEGAHGMDLKTHLLHRIVSFHC